MQEYVRVTQVLSVELEVVSCSKDNLVGYNPVFVILVNAQCNMQNWHRRQTCIRAIKLL